MNTCRSSNGEHTNIKMSLKSSNSVQANKRRTKQVVRITTDLTTKQ